MVYLEEFVYLINNQFRYQGGKTEKTDSNAPTASSKQVREFRGIEKQDFSKIKWHERVKKRWDLCFQRAKLGETNTLQDVLDQLGHSFETFIQESPLGELKKSLDTMQGKKWYAQFADFVVKLPFRVAMNLILLTYAITKGIVRGFVHPIQAVNKVGRLAIDFVHQLSNPETWTKIGAGVIGASVGSSLVTGHPIAVIGLGVGGVMILGGVLSGILHKVATTRGEARKEALKREIVGHLKGVTMGLITGFFIGLMAGGIMHATMNTSGMSMLSKHTFNVTVSTSASPPIPTIALPILVGTRKATHKSSDDE